MEPSVFLVLLFITAAKSVSAAATCDSKSCCWLDIPEGYCGITLPTDKPPMEIGTAFIVKNLQEVDEAKLSYIIDIK